MMVSTEKMSVLHIVVLAGVEEVCEARSFC